MPDLRRAPDLRRVVQPWSAPPWRTPSLSPDATASFLNLTAPLAGTDVWQDDSRGRLWLYNLHYFDDVNAVAAEARCDLHRALIARWILENPPAQGAGWEPYPTSLRLVNWVKWGAAGEQGPRLSPDAMQSIAVQARWLSRRLEFHILGNHLWANGKALVMAGAFFQGPEADRWRETGLAIVTAELDEQVLPDGGHFERSPMYHAIIVEDVLDLIQLAKVFEKSLHPDLVRRLRSTATRMLRWLRLMTHPDGNISFFNDAAFGVAAPCDALERYAHQLGVDVDSSAIGPVEWLRDSGYVRMTTDRAVVLCDVAPVGPDYQPGHAHADTLSFELSLDGRRIVVNGGTSTYTPGDERRRQRSTGAHSTVEVDGGNSSDVWAAFRVGRRARPLDVRAWATGTDAWVEAAHDGYRRSGGPIHRRTWRLTSEALTVTDTLDGRFQNAVARFLLHPAIAAVASELVIFSCEPTTQTSVGPATWHPEFGVSVDTRVIEVAIKGTTLSTTVTWS
jgi:uncharacterized heparinase superfamily protein